MKRNFASAFENEYFYDKKGHLKVRQVIKGNYPTGHRPRVGNKHRSPKTDPQKTTGYRPKTPESVSHRHSKSNRPRFGQTQTRTRADDFDDSGSWDDDNYDSDEPNYDSKTVWNYGDSHNDGGNDW